METGMSKMTQGPQGAGRNGRSVAGKTVVMTDGERDIGSAICVRLAGHGALVVMSRVRHLMIMTPHISRSCKGGALA
jgi:hypothetical protein